jgi:hypothetical protein
MTEPSLLRAQRMARKISRRRILARVWPLWVPMVGYVGSICTIVFLWFNRGGSFKFQYSLIDWGVLVTSLVVILIGGITIKDQVLMPREFTVSREELASWVASIRATAEVSIRIMAGDLSWLADDMETLLEMRSRLPDVNMYLYYRWDRVLPTHARDLNRLVASGTRLCPYLSGQNLSARFTLIDMENRDTVRALTYQKLQPRKLDEPRNANRFRCIDYGLGKMTPVVDTFAAMCELLEENRPGPTRISVSGINNVGKTRLATALRDMLVERGLTVRLVPDQYRTYGAGASYEASQVILIRSILELQKQDYDDVVIFDRSVLDDFIFLQLRSPNDTRPDPLAGRIADALRQFAMILRVTPPGVAYMNGTTHVSRSDRVRVDELFRHFLHTYDISVQSVVTGVERHTGTFHPNTSELVDQIETLVHYRRQF